LCREMIKCLDRKNAIPRRGKVRERMRMRKTKIRKLRPRNESVRQMTDEDRRAWAATPDAGRLLAYNPPVGKRGVVR
jgi:methyl coenzyme M reductase subunit C-like uncharacterized protein (methanogenesis marker protein 7)